MIGRYASYVECILILPEFRSGKSPLLVATDVASRGLGMLATSFTRAATARPYLFLYFQIELCKR